MSAPKISLANQVRAKLTLERGEVELGKRRELWEKKRKNLGFSALDLLLGEAQMLVALLNLCNRN